MLHRKQTELPPPPVSIAPVPDDLNSLCAELLQIDPADRPTGDEVLRRLGAVEAALPAATEDILFGRDRHLASLQEAVASVRQSGTPVMVEMHGPSGAGKSSLARSFLRDVQADGASVLAGQCYEQSAVPYKALDSLVGALCRHLRKMSREKVDALLPVHLGELTRLFPVFGRIDAVAEAAPARADDPHEMRRRAHQAFRELFHRMARSAPLILFVDDVQWGDAESAALVAALVRRRTLRTILFLAGYRRGDGAASPFVRSLREIECERRGLAVDPLTMDEARALATALLDGPTSRQAAAVLTSRTATRCWFTSGSVLPDGNGVRDVNSRYGPASAGCSTCRRATQIVGGGSHGRQAGRPRHCRTCRRAARSFCRERSTSC